MLKELKALRREWRTEATLRRKAVTATQAMTAFGERNRCEANMLEMCADALNRLIRAKEKEGRD